MNQDFDKLVTAITNGLASFKAKYLATATTPPVNTVPMPTQGTSVTDAQGNVYSITAGKVYESGKLVGFTDKVTLLVYANSKVYQQNSAGNWWYWDGLTNWIATTDPRPTASSVTTPPVVTNPPVTTPSSTGHAFGFAANAFQSLTSAQQTSWLADFKNLGVTWLRMDANWANIGSSNWGSLDQAVKAATAAGVNVLLICDGNNSGGMFNAPDPTAFAAYCKMVVSRYAPMGVHTYEVWNEANNTAFWQPNPDPAQYTAVLKAAYPAIKSADPASTVLGGGMCPCAIAPITFLEGMYAAGAKGFFDALSLHPYTYPAAPDAGIRWQEMNSTTPSIRSVMAANDDSAKQIWVTEFGAPTSQYSNAVTEAVQATQLAQAITDVKGYSWAGPMFIYTYLTAESDPQNNEDFFGIVHKDQTPKPAYAAIKTAIGA